MEYAFAPLLRRFRAITAPAPQGAPLRKAAGLTNRVSTAR
jgi:hypothetical protein